MSSPTKKWEKWEDELLFEGLAAGKAWKDMPKDLPQRLMQACHARWGYRRKHRSQDPDPRQLDPLNVFALWEPNSRWKWEDWEDQILIKHRVAGEIWKEISKLLPTRTVAFVIGRWKRALEAQQQKAAAPSQGHSPARTISSKVGE